ncbi:MAG TPA: hypothetical protein VE338_16475, partial [Ktedonobacterales bacterium]|nr:hypothetical protein [Ktedonobacterales bacterium]
MSHSQREGQAPMWNPNAGQGTTPQQANQRPINRPRDDADATHGPADAVEQGEREDGSATHALDALTADDAAYAALSARGAAATSLTEAMRRAQTRALIREFLRAVPRGEESAVLPLVRPDGVTRVLTRAQLTTAIDRLRPRQRQ